jgi:hypothetical protein
MTQGNSTYELEQRGVDLANKGQYTEARELFKQALPMKSEPLQHGEVLRNIMFTYREEGNTNAAIATCKEILAIPGLSDTMKGTLLHGQIAGELARLEGSPPVLAIHHLSALFAAYFSGAALGAAIGWKMLGDIRYTGAYVGAFLGFFLLTRTTASVSSAMSIIMGISCFLVTAYILFENGINKGLPTMVLLTLLPIVLSRLVLNYLRH